MRCNSHLGFLYLMVFITITLSDVNGFHSGTTICPFHSLSGDSNNSSTVRLDQSQSVQRKLFSHRNCTSKDISISQKKGSNFGIPQYIVKILISCEFMQQCSPSNVHFHCGWFDSLRYINPMIFKRLSYDDCLVNGGKAMRTRQVITFTYSNTIMYPLSFKSAKFC